MDIGERWTKVVILIVIMGSDGRPARFVSCILVLPNGQIQGG